MSSVSLPPLQTLGICLEEYEYPYPGAFLSLSNDLQPLKMAYMDLPPDKDTNGKTVVLFHGKAFGCYYFNFRGGCPCREAMPPCRHSRQPLRPDRP
jgi:hypothetical protein